MAKSIYGHRIGANVYEPDAPPQVKLVPDNKTLIALPFNEEHDDDVEPQQLRSLKEIFEHYQPSKEVVLKNTAGDEEDKVLQFTELKDFTKEGIINQSPILQNLQEQESVYSRMVDVLNNNQKLRNILSDETDTKNFLELIETLIEELSVNE